MPHARVLAAVPAVLCLAAVAGPALAAPASAGTGPTVAIGLLDNPFGFNVNSYADSDTTTLAVDENLLPSVFRTDGGKAPVLDKNIVTSAAVTGHGPMRVTYEINRRATWSDGVPVDASDFTLAWKAQNGRSRAYDAASTGGYDDITSVAGSNGGKKVVVTFKTPYADWRALFTTMLPAHLVHSAQQWNTEFARKLPVSAGPYLMTSSGTKTVTEVRNPAWWGRRPGPAKLVFRFYGSDAAIRTAFGKHQIDVAQPSDKATTAAFAGVKGGTLTAATSLVFEHLELNLADPLFSDLAVRHAIGLALNTDAVASAASAAYGVKVSPTHNRLLLATMSGGKDTRGQYGHGDAAAAASLLTQDGWALGSDGVFAKTGVRLAFTVLTPSGDPTRLDELAEAQRELGAAGIAMTVQAEPSSVIFGSAVPQRAFQALYFAWVANSAATVTPNLYLYESGGSDNFTGLADHAVDTKLAAAGHELDAKKAEADLNAVDAQLWNDAVSFPLMQKPTWLLVSSKLRGVRNETGGDMFTQSAAGWSVR